MTQVFLVERSIELSNLDDIYDMSRQRMIWEGLSEIENLIILSPPSTDCFVQVHFPKKLTFRELHKFKFC
jgi:hypothetical protein